MMYRHGCLPRQLATPTSDRADTVAHHCRNTYLYHHHSSTQYTYHTPMGSEQSVDDATVSRDTAEIDGTEYRMYHTDSGHYPSVSTVLDARATPEKDKSIQGWKNWLKGQPDRPDPSDVLDFKSWRGTLAHWAALNPLATRNLAGNEEAAAYDGLNGWQYRHDDALKQARSDIEWVEQTFQAYAEEWSVATFEQGRVTENNTHAIERYVTDDTVGFGGQFDFAYEHPSRGTVMADIKTSKADTVDDLFDKKFPDYGMQLAAYARAWGRDVDECQLWWLAPDTREAHVIPEDAWPQSRADYEQQFVDAAQSLHQTLLDDYNG